MKKTAFSVTDLVNAGLFSLLIVAVSFVSGMIGFVPITMPIVPFFGALISGPLFMLYSARIHRFGMMLIMGLVSALVFIATGHTALILLGTVLAALAGEYILKKGGYQSIKHARWAYVAYSLSSCFNLLPIYLTRADYVQHMLEQGYGQDFADQMMSVLPDWSFLPIVVLGMVGAYLGCTIGIKMLKKHFKQAGMA
ncbi:MptD family putative ECF transporter S component [Streptococcus panodentis]|uniref:Trep_Strep domain-containing protein n=1 Tax=Streptococcus panodentis TaxID=1581472 RepID=A0ABS5ATX0_9STRE|nr:MptD family putative ECF transporter S component [Streptococcus panodentis]MBP2620023.1 hypothetical protein [Streptococcus panodentis]